VIEAKRGRRKHTARELGERFGISDRTIRRIIAEPRPDYESRASDRREQIIALHRQGLGVRTIGRQLSLSHGLVSIRLKEAREAGVDLSRIDPEPDPEGARDDG
jgi:DNA-binding NarL/FixJ family response regulator